MAKQSELGPEAFERLIRWLGPDREEAGRRYVEIYQGLVEFFLRKNCENSEELADEVVNRVTQKVMEGLDQGYEGEPARYFYGVAKKLVLEQRKKVKQDVSLSESLANTLEAASAIARDEESERMDECLTRCLLELDEEKRKLITAYYENEKQAKIEHHKQLAESLGITTNNLRVRILRIRLVLEECIKHCCAELAQQMK